jgi:hypothetical protein
LHSRRRGYLTSRGRVIARREVEDGYPGQNQNKQGQQPRPQLTRRRRLLGRRRRPSRRALLESLQSHQRPQSARATRAAPATH